MLGHVRLQLLQRILSKTIELKASIFLLSRRQGDPSYISCCILFEFQQLDSVLARFFCSHANGSQQGPGPVARHMRRHAQELTLAAAGGRLCCCWSGSRHEANGASGRHALGSCPRPFR